MYHILGVSNANFVKQNVFEVGAFNYIVTTLQNSFNVTGNNLQKRFQSQWTIGIVTFSGSFVSWFRRCSLSRGYNLYPKI